jgi:hypothetical protein
MYVLRKKKLCLHKYVTITKTTCIHPQKLGKRGKVQELTLFYFPWNKMYVHCRDREHEEIDVMVDEDPTAITTLKQCGLWKFFRCPFMRAQPRLLNALVDYWHSDAKEFMIEGYSLTPTTEDICFLIGLSRRGEPFNLQTFPPRPFNIED